MTNDRDLLIKEEDRRVRMLRVLCDMLVNIFLTRSVTPEQADSMIRGLRGYSEKLFPGKRHVFDLVYLPRFRRALEESGMYDLPDVLKYPLH